MASVARRLLLLGLVVGRLLAVAEGTWFVATGQGTSVTGTAIEGTATGEGTTVAVGIETAASVVITATGAGTKIVASAVVVASEAA